MGEPHAGSTPALALLVARGVPHTVYEYEIEAPSGPEAHRGARVAYGSAAAAALAGWVLAAAAAAAATHDAQ